MKESRAGVSANKQPDLAVLSSEHIMAAFHGQETLPMCGIVGAVAKRPIANLLIDGLKKLEYRGYDSAGIAVIDGDHQLKRLRVAGKVRD